MKYVINIGFGCGNCAAVSELQGNFKAVQLGDCRDITAVQNLDRFLPGNGPIPGSFVVRYTTAGQQHSEEQNQQEPSISHQIPSVALQIPGCYQYPIDEQFGSSVPELNIATPKSGI
jgi:hypothetical protein